jgi:hypothetical protein
MCQENDGAEQRYKCSSQLKHRTLPQTDLRAGTLVETPRFRVVSPHEENGFPGKVGSATLAFNERDEAPDHTSTREYDS